MLLGYESKQEQVAIGLRAPQSEIRVTLHGLGAPRDVTRNHSIASLRPLTLAIGFDPTTRQSALQDASLALMFTEISSPARELGRIHLRFTQCVSVAGCQLGLFETDGHRNHCLSPLRMQLYDWYRQWEMGRRPAHNFRMTTPDLQRQSILYICPRPVVLVTAAFQDASNIFPMDLLGPVEPPYLILSLRTTNPAVRLMREARRIVLSSISFEWKSVAYELGKQHRVERINWADLPFETMPSPAFGLAVPRAALDVSELCVQDVQTIGSHACFITTIAQRQSHTAGLQLHHIHELYDHYRQNRQRV